MASLTVLPSSSILAIWKSERRFGVNKPLEYFEFQMPHLRETTCFFTCLLQGSVVLSCSQLVTFSEWSGLRGLDFVLFCFLSVFLFPSGQALLFGSIQCCSDSHLWPVWWLPSRTWGGVGVGRLTGRSACGAAA